MEIWEIGDDYKAGDSAYGKPSDHAIAGISVGQHGNAIEFYNHDLIVAQARRDLVLALYNRVIRPIKDAPRDGREVLCTDGVIWRVCRQTLHSDGQWEFFRNEKHSPADTWSMVPTHFILLEDLPQVQGG